MNREFLTDEDIHALDEDSEIIVLQNKLDKANEKIEELEDKINTARKLIDNFIKLNLQVTEKAGDYSPAMVKLYRIELKSYRQLEELLSDK